MAYLMTTSQIEGILARSNIDRFDRESILDTIRDLEELADCDCDECDCEDQEDEIEDLEEQISELESKIERLEADASMGVRMPGNQPHPGSTPDEIAIWIEELTADLTGALKRDADEVVRWIRARW